MTKDTSRASDARPQLSDVWEARRRISGYVRPSPVVRSPWIAGSGRAEVWLKLETLHPTRSFKVRGAYSALLKLARGPRPLEEVVTASAGNHGAAISRAARDLNVAATVFAPRSAPRTKLDAIRALGATLHADATDCDEAERSAERHARQAGAPYVSPYADPAVIAGAGTIGLELLEDLPALSTVIVPVGGGGLVSGIALVMKAIRPDVRVVGAEAARNPALSVAVGEGRITPIEVGNTVADGLSGNLVPGSITFELVRDLVDELTLVPESGIVAAMRQLLEHDRLIVEGAGAVAVAAAAARAEADGVVAAIVSGANIDLDRVGGRS